jgi:RNA polymerase-binding transcription factor DksA
MATKKLPLKKASGSTKSRTQTQKNAWKSSSKSVVKSSGNKKDIKKNTKSSGKVVKPVSKKPTHAAKPVGKKHQTANKNKLSKNSIKPVKASAKTHKEKPVTKKIADVIKKSVAAIKKAIIPEKKPMKKTVEPVKKPSVTANTRQEVKHAIKPLEKPVIKLQPAKPVKIVIPKTSTTRSVKYQPEFTKSVLDSHAQESQGPTMRYSDSELTEFRELISRKLETAKKELAYLQGLITRKDESGDMEDGRYMTMEDGSMSMEREQLSQMASRQIQFIDHLEKAMMRIENKTYGICRVTGKLIDKARLRAVPHATLSIEAKQMMNK